MDINRKNLDSLFTGFNMQFQHGFKSAPSTWEKFCSVIPSSTSTNVYPFLEQFGGMREWIGDRQIKNLSSRKLEVINRDFEDTVSVKRNDIEDDQYGIYGTLIAQMGFNASKVWQDLAVEALEESAPKWLDDEDFFGTTRKYGDNVIANSTGDALSESAYQVARQKMMEYKGHNGKSIGIVPNLLIVGPKNESMAFSILKDRLKVSGTTTKFAATDNPLRGTAGYIVIPELSDTHEDKWFLAATSGILKPLIVQQRQQSRLIRLDKESDENVFSRKEYVYGTDARGEAFLAFPHLIYRGGTA